MPGGVLQWNILYSGLLITDKQDGINGKAALKVGAFFFLKTDRTEILHEFKYNHQSANIQTENINKLEFMILACAPSSRNCKTFQVKYLIKEVSPMHSSRSLLQGNHFPLAGVSTPDGKNVSAF